MAQVSLAWSNLEYFYSLLDGMLVHRRVTPQHYICRYSFAHLGRERHCESKEHITMSLARAQTGTARSRVQCTYHWCLWPSVSGIRPVWGVFWLAKHFTLTLPQSMISSRNMGTNKIILKTFWQNMAKRYQKSTLFKIHPCWSLFCRTCLMHVKWFSSRPPTINPVGYFFKSKPF